MIEPSDRPAAKSNWLRHACTAVLIAYWSALFVSTHTPMPDLGELPPHSDKAMHFVAYAGLSFLLGLCWSMSRPLSAGLLARVFAVTAVYAALDELLQTIPVINRTGDVYDALADCCGSLIGLGLLLAVSPLFKRLRSVNHAGPAEGAGDGVTTE